MFTLSKTAGVNVALIIWYSGDAQNVEDSLLSDEEIERTLQVIDNQWHNVFRSIRKCMMSAY